MGRGIQITGTQGVSVRINYSKGERAPLQEHEKEDYAGKTGNPIEFRAWRGDILFRAPGARRAYIQHDEDHHKLAAAAPASPSRPFLTPPEVENIADFPGAGGGLVAGGRKLAPRRRDKQVLSGRARII